MSAHSINKKVTVRKPRFITPAFLLVYFVADVTLEILLVEGTMSKMSPEFLLVKQPIALCTLDNT